ncbi:hypothetical protein KV112_04460 [Mycolicibacter sp. MYC123]|uniref:Uncharacterized protein n=1 Tax=[Mycobacterium] zoologicum TaxID=2872311 RepID=A0ABU5YGN5_9MYCO|nr:hypothetical protein [Mycolicibacter sp. MYC123]MEB3049001.1 hypothetical protein [Mycolicibacter sp. MYC123]
MNRPLVVTLIMPDIGTVNGHLRASSGGRWHGELATDDYEIAVYVNPRRRSDDR